MSIPTTSTDAVITALRSRRSVPGGRGSGCAVPVSSEESGYGAVTIDTVVKRAGTSRPAFYRRYRNRGELVIALLVDRFGVDASYDTGSLRGDLETLQYDQLELFTDSVLVGALPGLFDEFTRDRALAEAFVSQLSDPRRSTTGMIFDPAAARGEIEPVSDYDWIYDLVTGPLMIRILMPGTPELDERVVHQTVDAALVALGAL